MLGIVLLVLGISFAYPLRNYFGQRADLANLQAQTAAQEKSVTDLQREIARWNDPAYVQAVARDRLHFVMPGDTLYVVLDDGTTDSDESTDAATTASGGEWWQRLWTSVEQADSGEITSDEPAGVPGEPPGATTAPTTPTTGVTPTTGATTTTGGGAGG